MMKDQKACKITKEFSKIAPKTFEYRVQRDDHEVNDINFIKAKGVKTSLHLKSSHLKISIDVFAMQKKTTIINERVNHRSFTHKMCTTTSNEITVRSADDKEIREEDRITTHPPHSSDILYTKHFNHKETPASTEELKQIFKEFITK